MFFEQHDPYNIHKLHAYDYIEQIIKNAQLSIKDGMVGLDVLIKFYYEEMNHDHAFSSNLLEYSQFILYLYEILSKTAQIYDPLPDLDQIQIIKSKIFDLLKNYEYKNYTFTPIKSRKTRDYLPNKEFTYYLEYYLDYCSDYLIEKYKAGKLHDQHIVCYYCHLFFEKVHKKNLLTEIKDNLKKEHDNFRKKLKRSKDDQFLKEKYNEFLTHKYNEFMKYYKFFKPPKNFFGKDKTKTIEAYYIIFLFHVLKNLVNKIFYAVKTETVKTETKEDIENFDQTLNTLKNNGSLIGSYPSTIQEENKIINANTIINLIIDPNSLSKEKNEFLEKTDTFIMSKFKNNNYIEIQEKLCKIIYALLEKRNKVKSLYDYKYNRKLYFVADKKRIIMSPIGFVRPSEIQSPMLEIVNLSELEQSIDKSFEKYSEYLKIFQSRNNIYNKINEKSWLTFRKNNYFQLKNFNRIVELFIESELNFGDMKYKESHEKFDFINLFILALVIESFIYYVEHHIKDGYKLIYSNGASLDTVQRELKEFISKYIDFEEFFTEFNKSMRAEKMTKDKFNMDKFLTTYIDNNAQKYKKQVYEFLFNVEETKNLKNILEHELDLENTKLSVKMPEELELSEMSEETLEELPVEAMIEELELPRLSKSEELSEMSEELSEVSNELELPRLPESTFQNLKYSPIQR